MRILFVALMIALLPLRGWVGDAMAMTPASQTAPASHAPQDEAAYHEMADCHVHAAVAPAGQPGAHAHDDHAAHDGPDCGSCSACQICHSVALAPGLPAFAAGVLPVAAPQAAVRALASAERAPGFKPPIS